MRKFFALALAVAMVLSLASVSFAATSELDPVAVAVPHDYSADKNTMTPYADKMAEYGDTVYFPIVYDTGVQASAYEEIEKMKIKTEFEMGEELVDSISIVKKGLDTEYAVEDITGVTFEADWTTELVVEHDYSTADELKDALDAYVADLSNFTFKVSGVVTDAEDVTETNVDNTQVTVTANDEELETAEVVVAGDYYYYVAMKLKDAVTTADADVIGTFEFNRKENKKNGNNIEEIDEEKIDFAFNVWYENNYLAVDEMGETFALVGSEGAQLKWDDMYILKFDCDEEVDIEFGEGALNEGVFTVDVSGQSKIAFEYNTKANEAICDANPGVEMFFVNFNGAKFNRVGQFEYEMEDMVAAYEIVDDKLVEINGLEVDGEVATFYTRTLGAYVFATAELVNPVVDAPVVEAPAVTNPTTGAAA